MEAHHPSSFSPQHLKVEIGAIIIMIFIGCQMVIGIISYNNMFQSTNFNLYNLYDPGNLKFLIKFQVAETQFLSTDL